MNKLFQFAVVSHPTDKEREDGKKELLVVDVTSVLAEDEKAAALMAARAIPEEWVKDLDRLEVLVRPFK